jgi:hypothetical protein
MTRTREKQTANKRSNGTFAPGNKIGNRFPKGETGNPNGRPKLTLLSEALRVKLAEAAPELPERTVAEIISNALVEEAFKGNVQAIREIADRTEGKPKQSIDVDMRVSDWREMARAHGLNEQDVINEARRLIEDTGASCET